MSHCTAHADLVLAGSWRVRHKTPAEHGGCRGVVEVAALGTWTEETSGTEEGLLS